MFFAFAGFTPTYFAPIAKGTLEGISPVVHIHGLLFFSWTIFFVLQSWLIASGRTAFHRSIGLAGISLATAMVILGVTVNLLSNERRLETGVVDRAYAVGFSRIMAMVSFGILFALGMVKIKRSESHKRLMLFATCMLLSAAVARFYHPMFAPMLPPFWLVSATVDSILVACLVYDWKTLGRPHPVTLAAGSLLVGLQGVRFWIPGTEMWRSIYDVLLRLVV